MTIKNNNSLEIQPSDDEDFESFLKRVEEMDPEEARLMIQNIITMMEEDGETVSLPLRLMASDLVYGMTQSPVGLVYGIGGLGQLLLTGFITPEDIEDAEDEEAILEMIIDDFQDNFPTAMTIRDDTAIEDMIIDALQGTYIVNEEIFEALDATDLQRAVWKELTNIPYGTTLSYEELAERVGNPKAVRAVASAVGNNPISIAIPCHRIILKSGDIGEYHWGSDIKEKLLAYEKARPKA